MAVGRKGVFFTLIAIMMVTILAVALAPQEHLTNKDRSPVVNSRVSVANDYVKRLKYSYLDRVIETSGRSAMLAMVEYVSKTGQYYRDQAAINMVFMELMLNGSVSGVPIECYLADKPLSASVCIPLLDPDYMVMRDRSLFALLDNLENASKSVLYIRTSFGRELSDYNIGIYQDNSTGPWSIGVNLSTSYYVDADLAYWNISQTVASGFSILGSADPAYYASFSGSYRNRIYPTNISPAAWGIQNLSTFIRRQNYRMLSEAPSFLMRLYGNMSIGSGSICCGIESAISPNAMGINKCVQRSYIDWCFFGGNCTYSYGAFAGGSQLFNITGITTYDPDPLRFTGFKIDTDHAGVYNVSDYLASVMFTAGGTDGLAGC